MTWWCDSCGGLVVGTDEFHDADRYCWARILTTSLPAGWWIRSNLADHKLEWGYQDDVWGDFVDPIYLNEIVGDIADEEHRRHLRAWKGAMTQWLTNPSTSTR